MSGGTWDYAGYKIQSAILTIINPDNSTIDQDCPTLVTILSNLGDTLYAIEHNLDWHYEYDTHIDDLKAFEQAAIKSLRECVNC